MFFCFHRDVITPCDHQGASTPHRETQDLYSFIGSCGAKQKEAPIYAWNPEALLGITLIKGFEGFKINIDQGNYLPMPPLTTLLQTPILSSPYSIEALCIGQILDVFLGSTINTGTPYSIALSIIVLSSPFNAL
jgi:hypothetical protein